jgi:hypothetical protein
MIPRGPQKPWMVHKTKTHPKKHKETKNFLNFFCFFVSFWLCFHEVLRVLKGSGVHDLTGFSKTLNGSWNKNTSKKTQRNKKFFKFFLFFCFFLIVFVFYEVLRVLEGSGVHDPPQVLENPEWFMKHKHKHRLLDVKHQVQETMMLCDPSGRTTIKKKRKQKNFKKFFVSFCVFLHVFMFHEVLRVLEGSGVHQNHEPLKSLSI